MKKQAYTTPAIQVIRIQQNHLICSSAMDSNIGLGYEGGDELIIDPVSR